MILTRLLVLILFLVLIRFVVRLVREMLASSPRRPEVHRRRGREEEPVRGKRIIDVEFTEDRDADDPGAKGR